MQIRVRISEICEEDSILQTGEIEVAESYFGARRVKGYAGLVDYGTSNILELIIVRMSFLKVVIT